MKIALASAPVMNRNIDFNLQAMVDYIVSCSGKAELILFGLTACVGITKKTNV